MEKKKQNVFAIFVIAIMIIAEIISCVAPILSSSDVNWEILSVIACAEHLAVLYYVLAGYKKPHGNLLRYLMLSFLFTVCVETIIFSGSAPKLYSSIIIVCMPLMAYVSGRLNKIGQNRILMPLILALFIVSGIVFLKENQPENILSYVAMFSKALEWFVFCTAYFVRFKAHREAGLIDAPKE